MKLETSVIFAALGQTGRFLHLWCDEAPLLHTCAANLLVDACPHLLPCVMDAFEGARGINGPKHEPRSDPCSTARQQPPSWQTAEIPILPFPSFQILLGTSSRKSRASAPFNCSLFLNCLSHSLVRFSLICRAVSSWSFLSGPTFSLMVLVNPRQRPTQEMS